ncbi:hypothetical protein D3C78_1269800 [compost metagenome]
MFNRSILALTTWLRFNYYFMCYAKYRSFGIVQGKKRQIRAAGTRRGAWRGVAWRGVARIQEE